MRALRRKGSGGGWSGQQGFEKNNTKLTHLKHRSKIFFFRFSFLFFFEYGRVQVSYKWFLPYDEINANDAVGFLSFAVVNDRRLSQNPNASTTFGKKSISSGFALSFRKHCMKNKKNYRWSAKVIFMFLWYRSLIKWLPRVGSLQWFQQQSKLIILKWKSNLVSIC